ncbi:uncharacterized protein DSM5745_04872 [Aspergillus mulundensis]|uniref:Alpha/beta hydrolase fold-3 domain-containing protein n=1 Tax=Aspergillus mulundensis TaxID=1810919 RepID=A0A3D8S4U9_9EURO|nr:hypothetical protein DSM5745_04872 [Aspergillus mulundensis]RDW81315.1 hypothetical protein DSM5745_04872 [Aspergillus mulundensis]
MSNILTGKHTQPSLEEDLAPPSSIPRPRFDPALAYPTSFEASFDTGTTDFKFSSLIHTEHTAPGSIPSKPSVTLSIFQSRNSSTKSHSRPVLYYVHGGGQIAVNRFLGIDLPISFFLKGNIDAVYVGVEYCLAPEHRAPAAAVDCYAGLEYLADHADELGIDVSQILVHGSSGGAAPAAAACTLALIGGYPEIRAQMLSMPMLDDRNDTVSARQFERGVAWSGAMHREAWDYVLGRGGETTVSELMAPARATDLSGLPPAFIDVGECEVFRDEAVAYASRIWQSGGTAELHVWPGSYHGMFLVEPQVPVARAVVDAQRKYIWRLFGDREK